MEEKPKRGVAGISPAAKKSPETGGKLFRKMED
jgi:hypothetical protein